MKRNVFPICVNIETDAAHLTPHQSRVRSTAFSRETRPFCRHYRHFPRHGEIHLKGKPNIEYEKFLDSDKTTSRGFLI